MRRLVLPALVLALAGCGGHSPSGGATIAFSRGTHIEGGLYTIRPDGTSERRLTILPAATPAWSADGRLLAYTELPPRGPLRLVVVRADGTGREPLTGVSGDSPSWSPDGTRVAFVRHGRRAIVVLNRRTGSVQPIVEDTHAIEPAWSPGGQWIAYTRLGTGIFLVRPDGSGRRELTAGRGDGSPHWSGDGNEIAFVRTIPAELAVGIAASVYVMDASGRNVRRLTRHRGLDSGPAWSPDGKQLVFVRGEPNDKIGVTDELYVMDAGGGNLRRLTHDGVAEAEPSWRP